jgi:hypothetical protein
VFDEASQQKLSRLCDFVAKEPDHHRLSGLVDELMQLLDHIDQPPDRPIQGSPLSEEA